MILYFLLWWIVLQWQCTSGTTLKSGFGVSFDHVGQVHPALERQFLALDIQLPVYKSHFQAANYNVRCLSDSHSSNMDKDMDGCQDFKYLMQNHAKIIRHEERIIKQRIENILNTLPHGNPTLRKKRGLGMLIFGIASGLASAVNSIIMRKQINAMQSTVDILEQKHFDLENKFSDLSDDVIAIAQISSHHFNALAEIVNQTNNALITLAKEVKMKIVPLLHSLAADVRGTHQSIKLVAKRTARSQFHIQLANKYYSSMEWYLHNYEAGIVDLMQGKIPQTLIQPSDFTDILDKTIIALKKSHPSYDLVFPMVAHYYRKTDIVYTVENGHLIVVIPLLLKKQNQDPMALYAINTCFVPFNIGKDTPAATSHTKVQIDPAYIAVNGPNFAEISNTQLDRCENYNNLYLCEHYILQVSQQQLTCSSAIFWDSQPEVINDHCELIYIHKIQPPPCILESDTHVLLTNLGTQWQFRCESQNIPIRVQGSNFAVIPNSAFCECALVGHTYFIPQRLQNCENKPDIIELYYPVNAAVLSVFHDIITDEKFISNLSGIYSTPQDLHLPALDLEMTTFNDDILASHKFKQEMDLKRVASAIKNKKHMYLDREEKQMKSSRIENWFLNLDNIAIGITFILSLIGTLAAIIGIYNCVKSYKVMALYGFLMSTPTKVDAYDGEISTLGNVILERTYQLIIVASLFIVYRLVKYAHKNLAIVKILAPKNVTTFSGLKTHLMIEMGSAKTGLSRIYMCSLSANIANLKIHGNPMLANFQINLSNCKTHAIMVIDWPQSNFEILCDGIPLTMPTLAYISLWNYFKLKEVLKSSYVIRVTATYDGFTYILSEDTTFITPPPKMGNNIPDPMVEEGLEDMIVTQSTTPILTRHTPTTEP